MYSIGLTTFDGHLMQELIAGHTNLAINKDG